ncbi:dihydrofolate reductase family protein [Agromyces cerinus]|uniref:Dihydrofolate reductase n=1 Tax=Agromyces cerinus subsp. cerinus TaxID=232089 RepID=A0A1N6F2P8_9MICO|nr:dihydrofolate reductase family protein [Agromyces cerinus]SIN89531.1 Dihydrofolate reductase [Agromyces cerinus subsp. cerinus]
MTNHLSLDGVMQAPMSPEEDTRGGFADGGWALGANADPELGAEMGKGMANTGAMLFGHRTYDHMAAYWPHQTDGNPFTEHLNRVEKYVVTRDPSLELDWQHSTVVAGDAAQTVAELKATDDGDLSILGSGELVRALAKVGLIDEYVLIIHPVLLGSGQRMFEGVHQELTLLSSMTTGMGITLARYAPRDPALHSR